MAAASDLLALGDERFVSLTTFRRSGERVATPVWVARDNDALVITTPAGSGKVKRLITTGLAFLPMVAGIVLTSTTANIKLLARTGARPLVPVGMLLGAAGMLYLTGLDAHSTYAGRVLPALVIMGLGFGLIFAPSIATATAGVQPSDTGVASPRWSTPASRSAARSAPPALHHRRHGHHQHAPQPAPHARPHRQASVHGYTTAFAWSAAIFALGAITTAPLLRSKRTGATPTGAPALAH